MKASDGSMVTVTTRERAAIRIGVRDRDGKKTAWPVFTVADVQALERALKAARAEITRKLAKKAAR